MFGHFVNEIDVNLHKKAFIAMQTTGKCIIFHNHYRLNLVLSDRLAFTKGLAVKKSVFLKGFASTVSGSNTKNTNLYDRYTLCK